MVADISLPLATATVALQCRVRGQFFVVGPTAVGKSKLALDVAEQCNAEIVNADAFQTYRGLDILTGKPDAEARRRVPHHLLGVVELKEAMSAARFRDAAMEVIARIEASGRNAIVVSGSGLYTKALTHGFHYVSPPDPKLRDQLSSLSLDKLVRRLSQVDPELCLGIDLKNRRRVVRAIEIATSAPRKQGLVARRRRAIARGIFLVRDRDDLYARINQRVEAMFDAAVQEEVAACKNIGSTAAQALGLRQIQQLLAGKISREQCVADIQQATRRYAKRQLTWFRHQTNFPQLNLTTLSHREAVSPILRAVAQE